MASTSLYSPVLPFRPFSSTRKMALQQQKRVSKMVFASRQEAHDQNYNYYNGRNVDENLIVLRKRIHEMRMIERNYEPPSDWMDWEKRYYASYDSMICEAMGFLQSQLMNSRPSLALAMAALITLSVPTSTAVILFHLMEITEGVFSRLHLISPL